jgi:hypothetical protein
MHSQDHTDAVAITLQHVQQQRQAVWMIGFTIVANVSAISCHVKRAHSFV